MPKKIITTANLRGDEHRGDFETCPHCNKQFDPKVWEKYAITMVAAIVYGKHGSVAIISECPDCECHSWVHEPLESFCYDFKPWPIKWRETASTILKNRQLNAIRELGQGLCWKCANLEEFKLSTSTFRSCIAGSGPSVMECHKFIQANFPTPSE